MFLFRYRINTRILLNLARAETDISISISISMRRKRKRVAWDNACMEKLTQASMKIGLRVGTISFMRKPWVWAGAGVAA